jgi:hypothetical protein
MPRTTGIVSAGGGEPVFATDILPVRDAGHGGDGSGMATFARFWRWKEEGAGDEDAELDVLRVASLPVR